MKKQSQIEQKVFSYIEENHMLCPKDTVIVGVSGGADSVCLFLLLLEWAKKYELSVIVVHVNHGIRQEAEEDANYVKKLCEERQVPFYLVKENVRQLAKREKCSEEEAGRMVRYRAFEQIREKFSADKIAVAHNSNDRSETMLFHFFRGSGLKGLIGIMPVREQIIRPILCLERKEVEEYLKLRNIFYCQDITNQSDDYTRNRIRHHILPYAEKEIAAGCISHMAQTADMLLEIEDYLQEQTKKAMISCIEQKEEEQWGISGQKETIIKTKEIFTYHVAIQKRILYSLLKEYSPFHKDIASIHVENLYALLRKQGNGQIHLPFGIIAKKQYDKMIFLQKEEKKNGLQAKEQKKTHQVPVQSIQAKTEVKIKTLETTEFIVQSIFPEIESKMKFQVFLYEKEKEVPQNQCTKWFDYGKIKKSLVLRTRQTGDYLTISDGKGNLIHKSLKNYMITQKIPKEIRDTILVLAEENHVVWLVGYRISEYYKISENTKCILQANLNQDCMGSRTEEENGRTC